MSARNQPCLILALLVAACSGSAAQSDLEMAKTARSLSAEWAILLESRTRLTGTYSAQMRQAAARALASVAEKARRNDGPASREIAEIATLPANPSPAILQARAARARAIESRLETR
jgi:hypothetical protein